MWPVSDAYLTCCRMGGTRVTYADVTGADGHTAARLSVTAGDVGVALDDAVRRDTRVVLADPTGALTPRTAQDLLAPFGAEITVQTGWQYDDGSIELAPIGTFRIDTYDIVDLGAGTEIDLTGLDRAAAVQPNSALPVSIPAGVSVVDAIKAMVWARYSATFAPATSLWTVPSLFYPAATDLWAEAIKVAAGAELDIAFGPTGLCEIRPAPSIGTSTPIVLRFSDQPGDYPLWGAKRTLAAADTHNGVIVTSNHSSSSGSVRGEAWITDPTSPLRRGGPYGDRPMFVTSNSVTSIDQANAAAVAQLAALVGGADQLTFATVPNGAMNVGDVVEVDRAIAGIDGRWLITKLTVPFAVDTDMQVTARRTGAPPHA